MRDYHHFLFYSAKVEADRLLLAPDEAYHAATVLRLVKNDPFLATDGNGTVYTCIHESPTIEGLIGTITGRTLQPRLNRDLHLQIGLPEKAQFEALLVDLTALGVNRITPLISIHCQKAWWKSGWEKYKERLKAKMISAMKQSLYPYCPSLDPPTSFELACEGIKGNCLVADPEGVPFKEAMAEMQGGDKSLTALVGPPGGFAVEERFALRERGAVAAKIAETRLTTELATVVISGLIIGTQV